MNNWNVTILYVLNLHGKHKSIKVTYWVQEILNNSIFCDYIKKERSITLLKLFSIRFELPSA